MPLYDAFLSYSHAKDKPIAAALQSVVQRLGKPWYRRRALRVFRDDTSLSATPHLWPATEQALAQSRFLILLASPEAAASPWVGKELSYWLDHNGADTLLIAVTDGALTWDAAPPTSIGARARRCRERSRAGSQPSRDGSTSAPTATALKRRRESQMLRRVTAPRRRTGTRRR
jgi:TIR domain